MIAVLFELTPKSGKQAHYFELASALKSDVENIEGFVSIERFQSLNNLEKFLSFSVWRDEEAVARWRTHHTHQSAQKMGRTAIFSDYRLRVAKVVRDYGMFDRTQVPES